MPWRVVGNIQSPFKKGDSCLEVLRMTRLELLELKALLELKVPMVLWDGTWKNERSLAKRKINWDYTIRIIIFTVVIVKNFDRNSLESDRKLKKF